MPLWGRGGEWGDSPWAPILPLSANLGHAQARALLLAGVSIVLYVAGSVMHRVFFVVFEIWFGKHELCVPNRVPEALWPFFILSFGTRGGLGPPTGE